MALFPITGLFVGEYFPQLVAVDTDDTMEQVGKKVAALSVGHRIARPAGPLEYDVLLNDEVLAPSTNFGSVVAERGVLPLQWFDVRFRERGPVDA